MPDASANSDMAHLLLPKQSGHVGRAMNYWYHRSELQAPLKAKSTIN